MVRFDNAIVIFIDVTGNDAKYGKQTMVLSYHDVQD